MTASVTHLERAWIERELLAECHRAKREMPSVGDEEHPTRWDVRHGELDLLLSKWQATDTPGPQVCDHEDQG